MALIAAPDRTVRWVAVAEYARDRGLSEKTVYRRLRAGLIPGAAQPESGHAWRIPVVD